MTRILIVVVFAVVSSVAPGTARADCPVWSTETYQQLSAGMEFADETRAQQPPGSASWNRATLAAIESRRSLVSYLTTCLDEGRVPPELLPGAQAGRVVLVQNLVRLHVDLGNCSLAQGAAQLLWTWINPDVARELEAAESARSAAASCTVPQTTAASQTDAPPAGLAATEALDGHTTRRRGGIAMVVLGTLGMATAGGLNYQYASGGDGLGPGRTIAVAGSSALVTLVGAIMIRRANAALD